MTDIQVEATVEITQTETVTQADEAQPLTYSLFIPDVSKPFTLISSTLDRYNDSVPNSLKKDLSIIQQKVNLNCQTGSNNFFRNAKWSPDGSYLLTNSADDVIRLFQL